MVIRSVTGHIHISAYPKATPAIHLTIYLPSKAIGPSPVMVIIGGGRGKPSSQVEVLNPTGEPRGAMKQLLDIGWNSWNKFESGINDSIVREMADAMVTSGMRDAGYIYLNVDDTWEGVRDAKGNLGSNKKFPDMKALADYVHSKGLKFGIYENKDASARDLWAHADVSFRGGSYSQKLASHDVLMLRVIRKK